MRFFVIWLCIIAGKPISVILLGILLVLSGCTVSKTTTPGTSTLPTTSAAPTPSLTMTSPADGATLTPGDITVAIQVSNFSIVDKQGQANVAGQGHVLYFLDVEAPTTPGQPAIPSGGIWAHVAATTYTFTNVAAGTHTIAVELVNNDHTPLTPPVVAKVSITVAAASTAPSVSILSPTGTVNGVGDVTVTVQVSNFTITNKLGQANSPGEGHLHYFLDVDAPTTPGQPAVTAPGTYAATTDTSYTWHNVGPGLHKFSVELVNNDHTPLVPPVVATESVNVSPQSGQPGIVIASPTVGQTLPPGDVSVTVQIYNFTLASTLGGANVVGQGHIDYYLDVGVPTAAGKPAVAANTNFAAVTATSYTWPNVAEGTHTLGVQLVNNDDTPLTPPIVALVQITVKAPAPTTGTLQLFAVDAPFPGVDHILVTIANLETHQAGGAWVSLSGSPVTVDLMAVQGVEQLLVSKDLPPSTYTQVRFDITSVNVLVGAQTYPATVPTDKVRLVNPVTINLAQTGKVYLDFDASKDIVAIGANQYIFKPVIASYVPQTTGLQIITQGLSNASVGLAYSESLACIGGNPQMWSVTGGSLPNGLTLDSDTGVIKGVPTTQGISGFTVKVIDKSTPVQTATKDYVIRIAPINLAVVTTTILPSGERGEPYSFTLGAINGTTPYTWSWSATTGSLPPGLTLDPKAGVISGIPTASGDYRFSVSVTDSSYRPYTDTQVLVLHVEE